jgi:hypothetical protein
VKRPVFTYPMAPLKTYQDFKTPPESTLQDVLIFFSSNIEKNKSISTMISLNQLSPYVIYWHFHNWAAPVLSVNDLAFNHRYFWSADYFLDLDVSKESPLDADVIERRWDQIEKKLLKDGYIKLVASKEFADLGLTAQIYKREKIF